MRNSFFYYTVLIQTSWEIGLLEKITTFNYNREGKIKNETLVENNYNSEPKLNIRKHIHIWVYILQ
jgi:hypothetical protein